MNIINIVIDADSLIYKSVYRHQMEGGVDLERAYLEFCYEIGKIRSAVFRLVKYESGDVIRPLIVLSPKKTFRNELSTDYKAHRPKDKVHGIKQLKLMVMHRMGTWAKVVKGVEADDIVIYYANKYNWLVSAIDKDVINACPTSCYNYNVRRWEQPHMPHEIEEWYARQSLVGDSTDGIKGAQDVGEARAAKWTSKYMGDLYSWSHFVDMFGNEAEAEMTMNLIRMDGLIEIDNELVWKPWELSESTYWEI